MQQLLSGGRKFHRSCGFNDNFGHRCHSRGFKDLGLSVPGDVSVIGFDDIKVAAFNNPRLTTIRQPCRHGQKSRRNGVLNQLNGSERFRKQITVEPELIVRESTRARRSRHPRGSAKKSKNNAKSGTGFASTDLSQSPHAGVNSPVTNDSLKRQ